MNPPPADAELAGLADVVWAERAALEQLVFKLVALQLVLAADVRRFVGRCLDEVDGAWALLERLEGRRVACLGALAVVWDRPVASLRLADLAVEAPEPWATVFSDHRDHLRALAVELDQAAAENARLCSSTIGHLEDDLASIGAATDRGRTGPAPAGSVRTPLRLVPSTRSAEGSFA